MKKLPAELDEALTQTPMIPVFTVGDPDVAAARAKTLITSGFRMVNVTLRTPEAADCIRVMKDAAPGLIVGAGTILSASDINTARYSECDFLVTPLVTLSLLKALREQDLPVFPGASSPSEAQVLYEAGFHYLNFFPAESSGGVDKLKSMAGPLPHLKFMPTGALSERTVLQYLALPNVFAVGGSYMVPPA